MIPDVPFTDFKPPPQPIGAEPLIAGGPIAAMHRALQQRLLAAFPAAQFHHRTVPSRFTAEEFARFTERPPVVGLGWVKMSPVAAGAVRGRIWSGHAHWQIFFVVENPRVEALLLGDNLGVGMAGLLAVAAAALHGRSIAGIGSAQVGEGGQGYSETWSRGDKAMATLDVSVPFEVVDKAGLERLDDFLRLGQRWPGLPDLVADIRDNEVTAG